MSAENLSSSNNPGGEAGMVTAQGSYEDSKTKEQVAFTYSYMESYAEGQIPASELRGIASQTIDSALEIGFLQRLNGRLVAENGELMRTRLQFTLPNETVSLQASQTPQGRELWIGTEKSFVSLSDRAMPIVDLKKPDSEIMQSTEEAIAEVPEFLAELDEKIGEIEPEIPLVEKVVFTVNRV